MLACVGATRLLSVLLAAFLMSCLAAPAGARERPTNGRRIFPYYAYLPVGGDQDVEMATSVRDVAPHRYPDAIRADLAAHGFRVAGARAQALHGQALLLRCVHDTQRLVRKLNELKRATPVVSDFYDRSVVMGLNDGAGLSRRPAPSGHSQLDDIQFLQRLLLPGC